MNRIHDIASPFPIETVPAPLMFEGVEVGTLVDHDDRKILISSSIPPCDRAAAVADAITYAVRELDRPGPFAWIRSYASDEHPDHFVIEPAPARKPHRGLVRAGVQKQFNAYTCPSADVTVTAWPDRPLSAARAICRRVYREPSYLETLRVLAMPGVTIDTPRRRRRVA